MNNVDNDMFEPGLDPNIPQPPPLEYEVGEICKCFYNDYEKSYDYNAIVSQTTRKCQGYCRVLEKNPDDHKEYLVEVFEGWGLREKRLPGCCLRKVKMLPYTKEDAVGLIGQVVRTKEGDEYMQVVTVTEDAGVVRVNDVAVDDLLSDFVFAKTGAPCGRIVMLKADEAFGGEYGAQFRRNAERNDGDY